MTNPTPTRNQTNSLGFTVVELAVTSVIIITFLAAFVQSYANVELVRANTVRRALASDIAKANLRKFTIRPSSTLLPCTPSTMDLTSSAAASPGLSGALLGSNLVADSATSLKFNFTPEPLEATSRLGSNVIQKVVAYAPMGCGANYTTSPLKLVSTVQYGTKGDSVSHVIYLN